MKRMILIPLSTLALSTAAYSNDFGYYGNSAKNRTKEGTKQVDQKPATVKSINKSLKTNKSTKMAMESGIDRKPTSDEKGDFNDKTFAYDKDARTDISSEAEKPLEDRENKVVTKTSRTKTVAHPDGLKQTEIKDVQNELKKNGYDLTVDGYMGSQTTEALKKFQKDHSLDPTGKLDSATKAALESASNKNDGDEDIDSEDY